ncbi:laminin subunit alpha-1 [Chanos chanos]|uniref:Basement membrane-specific heparan sulfate proteoglycan core protein n=1 Tax=Chanos chanos TaxID=29144 RepID=A0A6J2UUT9_CHACN|nr:laminin subunit alpha-1 [Chanos chanos]
MKAFLAIVLLWASSVECQQRGLFPAILNLASNAEITTNATCGDPKPEMYCKLVEHVPGRRIRNPQCRICDANSANPKEQHPITNAIDGTNQWWQSPSIKNGRQFHWVTITLDLRQIFQVAYVIIKAANSPRPGNWILERSLDGVDYQPWQYYAISDTECLTRYNVTPRLGPPTYKRDDEVICTSYYSRLVPLEHGEIHTSLINGRPGADDLTPELLEFTSARYIRLRLQRIRTLNADLMTLSYRDPKEVDPIVTRRYYYSVKDISVGGMCICYGHAQSCPWDPVTKKLQCVCEHNTCGESCNECCPGYHQEPWQPGTLSDGNTCEKCNCHNKADNCYYNQTVAERGLSQNVNGQFVGGGVCLNCSQNTAGVNCETCTDGFYRPHKVSPYADNPCVECDCDLRGSISPACIRDDTHAKPEKGLNPGQCLCKEGFAGEKCDRCAFGYRDFPLCTRCECSLAGSHNIDPCRDCICKENVMGAHCDLCKHGFYNLQASNPEGCTECFCFGVSDVCESSTSFTSTIVHRDGWLLPNIESNSVHAIPIAEDNLIISHNVTATRGYHSVSSWTAPESFLGNKLTAYGNFLNFSVAYDVSVENVDKSLPSYFDLIIEGNGRSLRQSPSKRVVLTPLREQRVTVEMLPHMFVDVQSGRRVQRDELMTVLASVTGLRVRAHLNTSSEPALRLSTVSLDMVDPNSNSSLTSPDVEQCECPWGYSGTSCEYCTSGFYRVGGILFGGNCLPCECNDHAKECDSDGVCLGCSHNTTGPQCDQCLPGYYGDPTEGTAEDCQRCACPLTAASNNFSPTCSLGPKGFTCDQCQLGYTGTKCERCANGYYGDPTALGQRCTPCQCNGNVDPSEPGHCDHRSGECLRCLGHTSGRHCERCEDGYYGDAVTAKNCQACGCHGNGSQSSVCNMITGQCECKANVVGVRCDHCEAGFYGINSSIGCRACNCSQSGSVSTSCEEDGQCQCITGVTGDKCDRCTRGYYNFTENGCKPCDCAHTHDHCDAATGECICPPHTTGLKCEQCEEDHWGHDSVTGCKACNCSVSGSDSSQCDLVTGQCQCRPQFSGQNCDRCTMGFRNFPECTACNCNTQGTQKEFCDTQLGVCGCEDHGKCACKDNVGGRGCDECKKGTFGLSKHNPAGCSPCFCFGVSSSCEELGGLVRAPITLGSDPTRLRVVSQNDLHGTLDGVYLAQGEMVLDNSQLKTSLLTGPYYWRLPKQYQGNQLLSYGGRLSYTVAFFAMDGTGLSNYEPQVLIRGGHLRKLVIYADMSAPENGLRTQHDVPLTEHKWKYFNSVSEKAVSHSDFMSVLSSIEYIIVKASYGTDMQQSRISNITMETAVEAEEAPEGMEVAHLVETCECPPGYAGLSCQECAPGFYRQSVSELNMKGMNRPLIQPCVPCRCNNHSLACDLDTGECLGCQHNTAGEQCGVCAPGYYGQVKGSISDCSLCACPLQSNSFSPTCVLEGSGDFRCDACKPGYEGRYCERCSVGYYGNPSEPGGTCEKCQCSAAGSVHNVCDTLTGKCECKTGVRGHFCDQCEDRHVLNDDQCVSCNDECTGVLLDDLDTLELSVQSLNLTGVILAPYSLLLSLENQTREVKTLLSWENSPGYHLSRGEEDLTNLTERITDLQEKVSDLSAYGETVIESAENSLSQGEELKEAITKIHATIQALEQEVDQLNDTVKEDFEEASDPHLLEEMEAMLNQIRRVELSHGNVTAETEYRAAVTLLQRVQNEIQEPFEKTDSLKETITHTLSIHNHQLHEVQELLRNAKERNNQTNHLLRNISSNLTQFTTLKHSVSSLNLSVERELVQAQDLLTDALNIAEGMDNVTARLEEVKDDIGLWSPSLRKHVDTLVMELTKTDALQLVYRAEDHAQALSKEAQALNRSLSEIQSASLNATSAVRANTNVRADINTAWDLALSANQSASATLNLTEESLSDQRREATEQSTEILNKAITLNNYTERLVLNVSQVEDRLSLVRANIRNFTQLLPETLIILGNLPNGSREQVLEAKQQAEGAKNSLLEALRRLEEFRVKLEKSSSAVSVANSSAQSANELVIDSEETTNSAESKLNEAQRRTEKLFDQLKPLRTLGENLSRNLSDIREMINQARKQAASIKVAVSADHDCIRAYRPEISSSNFNTLTLTVKTPEPDNLLFYMGSSSIADFMALEMRHGKVAFLWDSGSGHVKLEYPSVQINNDKWHRINATRFGKQGSLTVQQLDSEPMPAVKATAPGSSTVMDIDKSTWLFVGGLGGQVKKSSAVKMTNFKGCMGEASLNEKNIGLWNYAEREGECGGCFMSPQAEETSFHFDGSGYSVVEKSLRSTTTSIVMFFKTLSPNGLLLYLASNGTRDFLSIELVEGRVHLTFELGSGALTMTSTKVYNKGSWYKITLQRNKRKGYLAIMAADNPAEREVMEAESPGTASDLNRSDLDPIYVGGLPASRPIRRQVVARSYVGCIKSVEIARTNFDLLRESYGVKKGCVLEPVRSVSVLGGSGFLEMPGFTLGSQTEIMTTFSTKNNTGLILAGFSTDAGRKRRHTAQSFLAVMLVSGRLEVYVNMVEGGTVPKVVIKSRNRTFSDGQEHSLILQRNKRTMTVFVDEDNQASMRLGSSVDRGLALSRVYVGGVPPGEGTGVLSTTSSFYGCIRNMAVDTMLLDLSRAVRYENVDMNSCLLEERPKPVVLPDDSEVDLEPTQNPVRPPATPPAELSALTPGSSTCAAMDNTASLQEAVHFGLSKNSHMIIGFKNRTVRTSFTVKLSVRTFASSGILYYMANANQQDYAILQLQGGRLVFSCDLGRGPASVTSPMSINNGLWHTVKTEFSKKSVGLSVDSQESERVQTKGHTLDVEGKLYLGGLPSTYVAKKIRNVTHSLAGCMQKVMFNSVEMNMLSPVSKFGTTSCFTAVQEGSFFNGTGYAAFMKDGYNVGSDVTVSLEFRSTALDGAILGISSTKVDAIGLELVNGQVVFNVNNGAGRISATSRSTVWLCDGRWHSIVAKKFKHRISVTVDGVTVTTENPYSSSTSAETKNPIYVGGYPGDVKQNCLTTRASFRGCMRHLRVHKGHLTDSLDFSSAFALQGVSPHSCPAAAA